MKPGYKQTVVGVIPEEWSVRSLVDVAEIRTGIAKNSNISVIDPVLVHYLRVANVQDGFLDLSEMSKIQVSRNDLTRYAVLPGDMLMNEGGDLDKLARGSIWRGEFSPCVHQNHVFVVRCGSTLSPEFLSVWTGTAPARRYFLLAGKQTTNLASINKTALGRLPVAVPSYPEQRAIAGALSDVNALIGGLDQLIAKKRDLKQAAMQQLLTGQTRLPGCHGDWVVRKLGDLAQIISGSTPKTGEPAYWNGGIKWSTPTDITGCPGKYLAETERTISELGLASCAARLLPAGALLLCSRATVGEVRIAGCQVCTNQGFKSLVCTEDVSNEFLYYKLLTMKQQMIERAIGSTFLEISKRETAALELSMPPLLEQTAIAEVLADLDAELAALAQRRAKTRALKQGMMQTLLTGRTRLLPSAAKDTLPRKATHD